MEWRGMGRLSRCGWSFLRLGTYKHHRSEPVSIVFTKTFPHWVNLTRFTSLQRRFPADSLEKSSVEEFPYLILPGKLLVEVRWFDEGPGVSYGAVLKPKVKRTFWLKQRNGNSNPEFGNNTRLESYVFTWLESLGLIQLLAPWTCFTWVFVVQHRIYSYTVCCKCMDCTYSISLTKHIINVVTLTQGKRLDGC